MRVQIPLALLFMLGATGAAQAADPVKGQQQFGPCTICHNVTAGAPDKQGPNLFGVVGKKAGTNRKGFAYSAELKASKIVWDDQSLDTWIKSPAGTVPHTKMEFVGVSRAETRANIIAFLKTAK